MVNPLSRLLTFGEVATLLGYVGERAARRVRRWLLAQPWADEVLVLWQGRKGALSRSRAHYRVSLAALREHVPQLKPRRDEALVAAREAVAELEESFEATREQVEAIARETGQRLRAAAQDLGSVRAEVRTLRTIVQPSLPFPVAPPAAPAAGPGVPQPAPAIPPQTRPGGRR